MSKSQISCGNETPLMSISSLTIYLTQTNNKESGELSEVKNGLSRKGVISLNLFIIEFTFNININIQTNYSFIKSFIAFIRIAKIYIKFYSKIDQIFNKSLTKIKYKNK
jgi:hypothetical protein